MKVFFSLSTIAVLLLCSGGTAREVQPVVGPTSAEAALGVDSAEDRAEAELRRFFEGKTVVLKIQMPATSQGVSVTTGAESGLDKKSYNSRVASTGIAIKSGDAATITKIKIKGEHIEFQLNGGGYGSDYVSELYTPMSKSNYEKTLEERLKTTTDKNEKYKIQKDLDKVQYDRQKEDRVREQRVRDEAAKKRAFIAVERLKHGSRFNVRFDKTPASQLTPEWLMKSLGEYVDFTGEAFGREKTPASKTQPSVADAPAESEQTAPRNSFSNLAPKAATPSSTNSTNAMSRIASLRKGLSRAQVDSLLGKPTEIKETTEASLKIVTCRFEPGDGHIVDATFVDGVLVRYTISSQ